MSEQKLRISFIGTGVMGGPMAGHLVKAGHALNNQLVRALLAAPHAWREVTRVPELAQVG